jgi:peptidoglycan/xylan/chitin deacetylase (PgdA/CDA1 family)
MKKLYAFVAVLGLAGAAFAGDSFNELVAAVPGSDSGFPAVYPHDVQTTPVQAKAAELVSARLSFLRAMAVSAVDSRDAADGANTAAEEQENLQQLAYFQKYWDGMDAASKARFAEELLARQDNDILYLDDIIAITGAPALLSRLEKTRAASEAKFAKRYSSQTRAPANTGVVKLTIDQSEIFGGRELPQGYYALTFDDGPNKQHYTASVIDTLGQAGGPGNFCCLGNAAAAGRETLKANFAAGNTINLHSWDHPDFRKLGVDAMHSQIDRNAAVINELAGLRPSGLFRFPYGARGKGTLQELNKMGYVSIWWSIDTRDWAVKDPETLMSNIAKMVNGSSRGIILMHDIHWQSSVVLPRLIELLKSKNATFVKLVRGDTVTISR